MRLGKLRFWKHGNTFRIDWGYNRTLFCCWWSIRLELSIEFPSTWHEQQSVELTIAPLFGTFIFYFPWPKRYDDHYQCSGPKFGFAIFRLDAPGPALWLWWGNDDGTPAGSRLKIIDGPWDWGRAVRFDKGPVEGVYDYTYTLRSGEVQHRKATVRVDEQEWRRRWLPSKLVRRRIWVEFDDEVGERSGTWKGGTMGCGYDLLPNESALECLRRMEAERKL